jgi:hypothetical protein
VSFVKGRFGAGAYVAVFFSVLVALFGLLWAYTATQRVNFLPEESGPWRAHLDMIARCDVGDVVILGSSRANAGFVPKLLGVNAVNLAMTGTTPIEAYYEALGVYRCPHPPKVAILSFSGLDLVLTQFFWWRSARFGLLNYNDLQEIAKHAIELKYPDLYTGSFGSEPPPSMKNWLYANHFPPYDLGSLVSANFSGTRRRENIAIFKETLAQRGQHQVGREKCGVTITFEDQNTSFKPTALHTYYLEKLLALLRQHGVKVLYISTPLDPVNLRGMTNGYARDYRAFLLRLERDHPGFRIVGPTFPSLGLCDFTEGNHLNQAGAETFSRSVAPLISAAIAHDP